MLEAAPTREIALSTDLLLQATLLTKPTPTATPTPATSVANVNWWIATTDRGDPYDVTLAADGAESVPGVSGVYNGTIAQPTLAAALATRRNSVVFIITAIGATIIDSQRARVVEVPST